MMPCIFEFRIEWRNSQLEKSASFQQVIQKCLVEVIKSVMFMETAE
jgi:hypothetical protein